MNEKKWRLVDDNVIVRFIDDLELEWWSNGVMEYQERTRSKLPSLQHFTAPSQLRFNASTFQRFNAAKPVLDLANKTVLPKRLGTHIINCVCHVERSETSLYVVRSVGH